MYLRDDVPQRYIPATFVASAVHAKLALLPVHFHSERNCLGRPFANYFNRQRNTSIEASLGKQVVGR